MFPKYFKLENEQMTHKQKTWIIYPFDLHTLEREKMKQLISFMLLSNMAWLFFSY